MPPSVEAICRPLFPRCGSWRLTGRGTRRAASAHARLGRLLLEKTDDVVRARLHLDQALRHGPENRGTILLLAEACLRSGEPMRTIRLLDQAGAELAERDGELLEAVSLRIRSGRVWEQDLRRPENALLRYRDAADLARQTGLGQLELSAIALLASACEKLGLWTEALEAQRLLSERGPAGRPRAVSLLAQARLLAANLPEKDDADRACARALREDPEFLDAALELCALRRGGPPQPLREALQQAAVLSTDPAARAALLAELGLLAQHALHDDEGALGAFTEALRFDPQCQAALSGAAELAERAGRIAEAVGYLEALSQLLPQDSRADTFMRLAAMAERMGDPAAAAQALAHAAAEPQAPLAVLQRLLSVQRRRGLWMESDALALRASHRAELEGAPTIAAEVLLEQLRDFSEPARAVAVTEMAHRLEALLPGNAFSRWTRVRLARLAGDGGGLREALLELLPLVPEPGQASPDGQLPRRVDVQRELGETNLALGRTAEAASAYEEVCRLDPRDEEAWSALAELRGLLGHATEEANCLEQLAELMIARGESILAAERLREAARLHRSRDPQLALADLKRAAAVAESAPEILAELAGLAEELGDPDTAARALAKLAPVLATPRERARAHRRSALLSTVAVDAVVAAQLAAESDPTLPWGQLFHAVLALQSGDIGAAQALSEAALAAEAAGPDALAPAEREFAEGVAWTSARALGDVAAERLALERLCAWDPGVCRSCGGGSSCSARVRVRDRAAACSA